MVDISWGYNGDVVVFFNQQCDIWECKLTVDISWGSSWIINGSLEYWWGNHAKRGSINPWALDHWWRCHGFIHEIITSLFGWLSPPGVDNLYPVGFVPWGIPSYIPIVYGPMKNMTYFHDISSWVTWASLLFPILPRCLGITKSWTNCDYQRWFPRPSHFMWKLISLSLSSRYHVIGLNVMRPRFFITFKPPVGEPHAPGCRAVGHQALNHSALLQELFSDLQTWEVFTIAEDGDKKKTSQEDPQEKNSDIVRYLWILGSALLRARNCKWRLQPSRWWLQNLGRSSKASAQTVSGNGIARKYTCCSNYSVVTAMKIAKWTPTKQWSWGHVRDIEVENAICFVWHISAMFVIRYNFWLGLQ